MKNLIIYGTKHGCAKRCAEILSEKLSGETDIVDIKEKSDIDLSSYEKVAVGGSIYLGKINKEIQEFVTKNEDILSKKDVGLYICSMNKNLEEEQIKNSFPPSLLENAKVVKNFGGEFRLKEMNFMEKMIVKVVSKSLDKENNESSAPIKADVDNLSLENIEEFANTMNKG